MDSRQCTGAVIRGVFLGNFFQPNRDLFPDADERFESNKILAAKTLQQLAPSRLEMFIFIEPLTKMQRQDEALVKNPPWPGPDEGYWLAVQAMQEMFDSSIKPAASSYHVGYDTKRDTLALIIIRVRCHSQTFPAAIGIRLKISTLIELAVCDTAILRESLTANIQ